MAQTKPRMIRTPVHLWLALVLSSAGPLPDNDVVAQQTTEITDAATCRTCRISFSPVVTLRGADDIGLSSATPVVRSGSQYVAAPTYAPGTLLVYDSAGTIAQRFGRPGGGPGEIQGTSYRVTAGPGDTIHVIDAARWSVFRPNDFRFMRSFRLPGSVTHCAVTSRAEPIISFQAFRAEGTISYIAVLNSVSGEVARTFEGGSTAGNPAANVHVLYANGDGVWASPTGRERVTLFRTGGGTHTWIRRTGWFPATSTIKRGEPFWERPSPRILDIRAEAELLWVFAAVADRNWQPRPRPSSIELPRVTGADVNRVFDGVIEVIDRRTGHVLARVTHDWIARTIPGPGNLLRRSVTRPDGDIEIVVMRVDLNRR